jgi:hypothetical protein
MDLPSNAGPAIFAALCIAGLAIVGSYTFAFAAHVFFAVAEATAAGQDELAWPDEPLLDRLGKGLALAWLVLVSLAPAFIVSRAVTGDRPAATWTLAASIFGLLFPVIFLSVHSAGSFIAVLYPPAIGRILARPEAMIGYYIAAMPTFAIGAFGVYGLHARPFWLGPVFAVLVAWAILTTARLIGRLALKISRGPGRRRRNDERPAGKPEGRPRFARSELPANQPRQANAYGLRATDAPEEPTPDQPTLKRLWIEDDDDGQPIALQGEAVKQILPESMLNPSEYELRLAGPRQQPKPPARTWTAGTYTFALRGSSLGRMGWLTTGITLASWLWKPIFGVE